MYSEQFLERFWAKVDKTGECWLWTGSKQRYGNICFHRQRFMAHRVSLEIHLGRPIADGMLVAHSPIICHNPLCVNPVHLREASPLDNSMDKYIDNTMVVGEHAGRPRKLTAEQILSIREDNRTHDEIAKDYNINRQHVTKIKNKQRYAWVL